MAAIDIGAAAIDRNHYNPFGYTAIGIDNPANGTGLITAVEVWAYAANMTSPKVGTFYGSGGTYTSRDYESIGTVVHGSKQTFTGLDIDVETGDYIGTYFAGGYIEKSTSGYADFRDKSGDQFGQGEQSGYYQNVADAISLYGTGETVAVGWTGIVMGVTNPAKICGVEVANISKVMGVS